MVQGRSNGGIVGRRADISCHDWSGGEAEDCSGGVGTARCGAGFCPIRLEVVQSRAESRRSAVETVASGRGWSSGRVGGCCRAQAGRPEVGRCPDAGRVRFSTTWRRIGEFADGTRVSRTPGGSVAGWSGSTCRVLTSRTSVLLLTSHGRPFPAHAGRSLVPPGTLGRSRSALGG